MQFTYKPHEKYPDKPYLLEVADKKFRLDPNDLHKLQTEIDAAKLDAYYNMMDGQRAKDMIFTCPRCTMGVGFQKDDYFYFPANCKTCGEFLLPKTNEIFNDPIKSLRRKAHVKPAMRDEN